MITHDEARELASKALLYGLEEGEHDKLVRYISQQEALEAEHEALKRDVARYFEIYDCELKQGEWWNEYTALKEKLSKVGKKK